MYIARFSYEVLPVNRQRAIDFIRKEVEAAKSEGLNAACWCPLPEAQRVPPCSSRLS